MAPRTILGNILPVERPVLGVAIDLARVQSLLIEPRDVTSIPNYYRNSFDTKFKLSARGNLLRSPLIARYVGLIITVKLSSSCSDNENATALCIPHSSFVTQVTQVGQRVTDVVTQTAL